MSYVYFSKTKYRIRNKSLVIGDRDIRSVKNIKGLSRKTDLTELALMNDAIYKIEGLSKLISLKTLSLIRNKIEEISGLEGNK
ncbi:MAG: hypothetical protein P8Y97_07760 [Candidatus Lokiarchaeota archaeon]